MKDKYFVPYETAKALKEIGYPQTDGFIYDEEEDGKLRTWVRTTSNKIPKFVTAPTYHEVIDWLKTQSKSIHISIYNELNCHPVYTCSIYYSYVNDYRNNFEGDTVEEVLNKAILEIIKWLKD